MTTAATTYGKIQGLELSGCAVFRGIPYAKPPVGDLRFAPPQKPDPWKEVRDCTSFGGRPYSIRSATNQDAESCLSLNIWTPAKSPAEKLAVMFWIYGGGFQGGSGDDPLFDGQILAEKFHVIVVTFNYRCGALGFFALQQLQDRDGTTGNYGVLDTIAALQWVKENINCFGGDPERILVFGQSAGGILTRILLTSPRSRGLFSRAVIQSGGGLNEADPFRSHEEMMKIGEECLRRLHWDFTDLLKRDAQEINAKLCETAKSIVGPNEIGIFQPCLDDFSIIQVPGIAISSGQYDQSVKIICGTVSGDAWMFCRKIAAEIETDEMMMRAFSLSPGLSWAEHNLACGYPAVYTYYMERTQPMARGGPAFRPKRYGSACSHSSDIPYVFGTLSLRSDQYTDLDRSISDAMMRYWTNFAKYGDPNEEGLPDWSACSSGSPVSLHIDDAGYRIENVAGDPAIHRVFRFVEQHPGFLTSLDDGKCKPPLS